MATRKLKIDGTEYNFTDKQIAFCNAYLKTLNGTEAARQANYKGNDNTISTVASENLRKPNIAAYIESRLSMWCLSPTETLVNISNIARGLDITRYITSHLDDETGDLVYGFNLALIKKDGLGDLIKSITPTRGGIKIEFHDRLSALGLLAKHHALLTDVLISAQAHVDAGILDDDKRRRVLDDLFSSAQRRSTKQTRESDT